MFIKPDWKVVLSPFDSALPDLQGTARLSASMNRLSPCGADDGENLVLCFAEFIPGKEHFNKHSWSIPR